jgi:AAA domain
MVRSHLSMTQFLHQRIVWLVAYSPSLSILFLFATSPLYRAPATLFSGDPYSFLQVDGTEERTSCGSYRNHDEAHCVVDMIRSLRLAATRDSQWHCIDRVRVITFYRAQVQLVQALLNRQGLPVLVATVDSSQGCEADLVIVSFVRSKGGNRISEGFLSDDRRVNVALTRAKHQLVCVGNAEAILKSLCPTSTLHGLASNAVHRSIIVSHKKVDNHPSDGRNSRQRNSLTSSSIPKTLMPSNGRKSRQHIFLTNGSIPKTVMPKKKRRKQR